LTKKYEISLLRRKKKNPGKRFEGSLGILVKIFCFIDPTARWHIIICSSIGNLAAMVKK